MHLRWGLCGAGKVCFDFANALSNAPDRHCLQAVASRDLHRAQEFADKFNVKKAYNEYSALANDPDVDVVYIGTLNNTHFELCKLFMEAGKAVLCEKALCCGTPQAEALIEVSQRRGVFLMEGLWTHTLPAIQKLRDLLSQKTVGSIRAIEANLILNRFHMERINDAQLGGGAMWFNGVYTISLVDMVYGGVLPQKVYAAGSVVDGVDADICATLQYSEGRYASLTTSTTFEGDSAFGHLGMTLFGDAGFIRLAPILTAPNRIEVVTKDGLKETGRHTFEFEYPKGPFKPHYHETGGLLFEADHVRDCLVKGLKESNLYPLSASLRVQNTVDDIRAHFGLKPLEALPLSSS